ncbi:hypothetical protein [Natrinema caseinilyticum]|uniref:hypothetical protein n=1 Tax=Natrinema caseinilyticum TaxID=2961570 RepID=UPI0020C3722C|nr:hypothetical protein [Natrinema caseinilyticum]
MNRPRSRRALLASFATSTAAATGGFQRASSDGNALSLESGLVPDGWYRCSEITRPTPVVPLDTDGLELRPYPEPPSELVSVVDGRPGRSSSTLRDGAVAYATEFERSYRQNAFLDRYGSVTRFFELRRSTWQATRIDSATGESAVLVSIVYNLTTRTRHSPANDEWDTRVTYYFDDRIALRARYDGIAEQPTFSPDPRREGDLVECFN